MSTAESEAEKKVAQKKKVNQRAGHRAHVNRIVKDAEADLQAGETSPIKFRLEGYKVTLSEKISVLSKLDDEIAEYLSEEEDFTSEFEKAGEYRETMQRLIRVINSKVAINSEGASADRKSTMEQFNLSGSESSQFRKQSKLPKLTIPPFKGNPLEWQSWWEGFNVSVHSNDDISPITKFNYLRTFLEGPALAAISGLSLIEANYGDAVGILHDRFGNKQLLISSNTGKLLSLPTINSSEDIVKLRDLYNKMETSVRNLQALDVEKEKYGSLLVSIVMTKLPSDITLIITRCMPHSNEEWSIDEFLEVFKKEVDAREISAHMKGTKKTEKKNIESNDVDECTASTLHTSERRVTCTYCRRNHVSSKCDVVTNVPARKAILRRKARCFLCLKPNHMVRQCPSSMKCFKCTGRHHISICTQNESSAVEVTNSLSVATGRKTLLQTAKAVLRNQEERGEEIRLLFDIASQRSFLHSSVAQRLQLPIVRKEIMIVQAFEGDDESPREIVIVKATLGVIGKKTGIEVELCLVPKICSPLVCQSIELAQATYEHLIELELADDTNGKSELKIDILLGADLYWKFMIGDICRGKSGPVAMKSMFGWVLSGSIDAKDCSVTSTLVTNHVLKVNIRSESDQIKSRDDELLQKVGKFWEIEDLGMEKANDQIIENFKNSISFDQTEKRYSVELPWKTDPLILPDNYSLAVSRLRSVYRRLRLKESTLKQYDDIIKEQLKEGILEPCCEDEQGHYLAHREVIREDRETNNMRIVNDGNGRRKGQPSLNDCLETGPSFLPKIFDVMVRFRSYRYALISDIKSAFLNIKIAEHDRNYLRILWVDDITKDSPNIAINRYTSVPFGLNCSPFLLGGTIVTHMEKYKDIDGELINRFLNDLYMDDSASGAQSIQEALNYYMLTKTLMLEGGFVLRKWQSNSSEVMQEIHQLEQGFDPSNIPQNKEILKILGITWNTISDELIFDLTDIVKEALKTDMISKRFVLRIIASIFDPLGILALFVVKLKLLFQEICALKCDWDVQLSTEFSTKWKKVLTQLGGMGSLTVKRCYFADNLIDDCKLVELHGFCDASEQAYCAVVYMRVITNDERILVNIISSKTKVVPLNKKHVTIPKLELMSCVILSKLVETVRVALKCTINISEVFYWTDSMDCYHWITQTSKIRERFVQSKIESIRTLTLDGKWLHCPGKLNPADFATRVCHNPTKETMIVWLHGPEYLGKDSSFWPKITTSSPTHAEIVPEQCLAITVVKTDLKDIFNVERYGTLQKLLRVTAYVVRFCNILKSKSRPLNIELNGDELQHALNLWILNEQRSINKKRLNQLNYTMNLAHDENGILRVKGRLLHSQMDYESKFPIFLEKDSFLTTMIIQKCHVKVKHCKVKDTLTELRSKYWVPQGRRTVGKAIKPCLTCVKMESKHFPDLPVAPLPKFRVTADFAFSSVGVDYLGPLLVKNIFTPDQRLHKVHIALFTCASSRAVSLDLVTDTTCIAFVRCLKRFLSRHGVSKLYISDNATCFTGPELTTFVSQIGSVWQFILPASPWWGGFWERLVKTVKRCLRKILGKSKLNYEELLTVIVEIEGVLNSRPLCYIYGDPSDKIITPSHLMIGRRLLSSCHSDQDPENVDFSATALSKRSKYISSLLKNFWSRWTREYLTELREHHNCKEKLPSKQIALEDVVLIEEGKIPRNQWKMGIVTDLVRSKDGIVRGCKLRTLSKGKKPSVLYRPVSKLYPLEISKRESADCSDNISSAPSAMSNSSSTPDLPEIANELPEKIEIVAAPSSRPRRNAATKGTFRRVQNKHK